MFTRIAAPLILAAVLPALAGCPANAPKTVDYVDLDRYLGLWYEIASYPTFFNEGLVGTTAEYSLNDDGTIRVFNRAFDGALDGPETNIEGTARVVDTETNAKLSVTFSDNPFAQIFPGQYWIVDLDEVAYSYAVVTDSFRSTLFILSRTAQMDDATYNAILDRLEADGFNLDRLSLTPQPFD